MTKYFSPSTCRQLEKLGCVASSGMWWVSVDAPMLPSKYVGQPLEVDYVLVPENECEFKICDEEGLGDYFQAFQNADFLSSPEAKENLIRVFGERERFGDGEYVDAWRANWKEYYLNGKKRTSKEAKKIMEQDYDYFVKVGVIEPEWQVLARQLLDTILSGGDGESFILVMTYFFTRTRTEQRFDIACE